MGDEFDALNKRLRRRLDSMTDDDFLGHLSRRAATVRAAADRKRRGQPCWCGNPVNGHAGWIDCALGASTGPPAPLSSEGGEGA